jgi:hypothetical protein
MQRPQNPLEAIGEWGLWGVISTIEILIAVALKRAFERNEFPLALRFALRQWRWPLPLRPLVCAWWVAHFVLAVYGADALQDSLLSLHALDGGARALAVASTFLIMFGAAYASNAYLILALVALHRSEFAARLLWRLQSLVDLIIVAGFAVNMVHMAGR